MLHDGYYSMLRIRAGKCSRCGCIKRKGVGISMDDQHHYILDCPVCGPYEAWEGSFPRIKASLPKQVEAGSSVGLRISLTGEWPKTDILPEDSQFVIHLKDTGRGIIPFRRLLATNNKVVNLDIPCDCDSAPELHTVRIGLVRGGMVAYLRLRTACLPCR